VGIQRQGSKSDRKELQILRHGYKIRKGTGREVIGEGERLVGERGWWGKEDGGRKRLVKETGSWEEDIRGEKGR